MNHFDFILKISHMQNTVHSKLFFRSITASKTINCSVSTIWELISSKSNLELFHPFCKTNNVISWKGVGSIDELEYLNGRKMKRHFVSWGKGIGYDLYINQVGRPSSFVSWRIKSLNNKSKISITVYPYLFNKKNKIMMIIPFYFFVHPFLKSYLNSVVNGLQYYITTGIKIKNNQFGKHAWFS